ncbi:hypothetical protein C4565_04950 [Candidatus Parcubacteria bacterium]|nr:MAG: hypothetical protein C4565_04950 [Candidatus Parcubacteria bacterium]
MKKKARRNLKLLHRGMQRRMYDDLFYRQKDPKTANIVLLVWESERFKRKQGIALSFGNFSTSEKALTDFIDRNLSMIAHLFKFRFPDPQAYSFDQFSEEAIDKFYKCYLSGGELL